MEFLYRNLLDLLTAGLCTIQNLFAHGTRKQFVIPSKFDLKSKTLYSNSSIKTQDDKTSSEDDESIYLCGNSLGLQPKICSRYVQAQLQLWATKGVLGHMTHVEDSLIPAWLEMDAAIQEPMAAVVGARSSEVAVMQTLSANLHLLMAYFYQPQHDRYKIIIETRAFPSDHFIVESQTRHHGHSPSDAMIVLHPDEKDSAVISTKYILSAIDEHAHETALLLLPGIQYYTGQLFDIPTITQHAQSKGVVVGWDLAHAAGNVPLQLHDWNVDFAVWCNYKYLNSGPGAIGGLFVHDRHTCMDPSKGAAGSPIGDTNGTIQPNGSSYPQPHSALQGWWGSSKATRFTMDNVFDPIPGAARFQLSNPSAIDLSSVMASLSVFQQTSMKQLREKSLRLTGYLETLLNNAATDDGSQSGLALYEIITPRDPQQRGAQLSIRLRPGMLDHVMHLLDENGIVVDKRKPDVVRVAPAPLYNTFVDCWKFVRVFRQACEEVIRTTRT